MDKNGLLREIRALYEECPGNTVSEAQALCPEVMGKSWLRRHFWVLAVQRMHCSQNI